MDVSAGDIIHEGGTLVSLIFGQPNSVLLKLCIEPFLNPAIIILCTVGGFKIGWSFLRRAFH